MESELDIQEIFWDNLTQGESEETRMATEEELKVFYENGFADPKRVPLTRWMSAFEVYPKSDERYCITRESLSNIAPLLFKGPIKKPFDPETLKNGPRPLSWLDDLYKKVLRFETVLKDQEWKNLIQNKIKPRFFKGEHFILGPESKEFLEAIIDHKSSSLRRLELWVHRGRPTPRPESAPPKKSTPQTQGIQDRFESSAKENAAMKRIEKLYYTEGSDKSPGVSDQESLDILDELAELEDDEESELP